MDLRELLSTCLSGPKLENAYDACTANAVTEICELKEIAQDEDAFREIFPQVLIRKRILQVLGASPQPKQADPLPQTPSGR